MSVEILCRLAPGGLELPLFSSLVPAGFPSPAQDYIERKISLDELLRLDAPCVYLVRVQGESMIGAGVFDGDLLIVDRSLSAFSGDLVIAAVNGEAMLKRFIKAGDEVVLQSENPIFPNRSITDKDDFAIWGVVSASLRCHRRHA